MVQRLWIRPAYYLNLCVFLVGVAAILLFSSLIGSAASASASSVASVVVLTDNNVGDYAPDVSGESVVWYGGDPHVETEIFFWDGTEITAITNGGPMNYHPHVFKRDRQKLKTQTSLKCCVHETYWNLRNSVGNSETAHRSDYYKSILNILFPGTNTPV